MKSNYIIASILVLSISTLHISSMEHKGHTKHSESSLQQTFNTELPTQLLEYYNGSSRIESASEIEKLNWIKDLIPILFSANVSISYAKKIATVKNLLAKSDFHSIAHDIKANFELYALLAKHAHARQVRSAFELETPVGMQWLEEKKETDDIKEFIQEQLMLAAFEGDANAIRKSLRLGANPNARHVDSPYLFLAVITKNVDAVNALLEAGADVNARDANHTTALGIAREQNENSELIKLLEQHGATE